MAWINDNAMLLYVLLGAVALVLALVWWNNRKKEVLIALGGTLLLILLVCLLSFFVVSDKQQIRQAMSDIEKGLETKNPEFVVKHLARDFEYKSAGGRITREDVKNNLPHAMDYYGDVGLYFWEFEFTKVDQQAKAANISFRMRAESSEFNGTGFFLCRSEFVLEDGKWRMKNITFYKPVADTDQPIRFPFPRRR